MGLTLPCCRNAVPIDYQIDSSKLCDCIFQHENFNHRHAPGAEDEKVIFERSTAIFQLFHDGLSCLDSLRNPGCFLHSKVFFDRTDELADQGATSIQCQCEYVGIVLQNQSWYNNDLQQAGILAYEPNIHKGDYNLYQLAQMREATISVIKLIKSAKPA